MDAYASGHPTVISVATHHGYCHCKRFEFTFEHPNLNDMGVQVIECNCTYNVQKGYLLVYAFIAFLPAFP